MRILVCDDNQVFAENLAARIQQQASRLVKRVKVDYVIDPVQL